MNVVKDGRLEYQNKMNTKIIKCGSNFTTINKAKSKLNLYANLFVHGSCFSTYLIFGHPFVLLRVKLFLYIEVVQCKDVCTRKIQSQNITNGYTKVEYGEEHKLCIESSQVC